MAAVKRLEIPVEVQDTLNEFDDAFTEVERDLNVFLNVPVSELHAKLTPLEQAKMDLLSAYTANSLFWMYLRTVGQNPNEHPIKQEITRIRGYMTKVKELEDKKLAPKIDKEATKKFVRNALWQAAHSEAASKAPTVDASKGSTKPEVTPGRLPAVADAKPNVVAASRKTSGRFLHNSRGKRAEGDDDSGGVSGNGAECEEKSRPAANSGRGDSSSNSKRRKKGRYMPDNL